MSFFAGIEQVETDWASLIDKYVSASATLLACSASSPHRRVYVDGGFIYKIVTRHDPIYRNTLAQEFRLLDSLRDLPCVPEAIRCDEHPECSVLVLREVIGDRIGQLGDETSKYRLSIGRVVAAFWQITRRGVRHGDAVERNLIVTPERHVVVLDFDQATVASPIQAFIGDFLGIGSVPAVRTVLRFMLRLIAARLPRGLSRFSSVALGARRSLQGINVIGAPPKALVAIWESAAKARASSPTKKVAYYSLTYGDSVLPGERAWEPRWAAISEAVDFRGKRLLELGCNLGLLSYYAERAGALPKGTGVDHDPEILAAARNLGSLIGSTVEFKQIDFEAAFCWEDQLVAESYQIVSALSVLNWLSQKSRFLAFLGRFDTLIFEGHDSLGVEVARLKSVGFRHIQVATVSERGRSILVARH